MSRYFVRTFKRRKLFLDSLACGDSESRAASIAGGTVKNFKNWASSDPEFAKDWADAIEEGTDFLEDVATARAIKKSDALMAMMLRARRPDKFDRGSKLELSGSVSVEGAKSKLLNRIARLQAQSVVQQGGPQEVEALPGVDVSGPAEEVKEQKLLPAPSPAPRRGSKRRTAAGLG